VAGTPLFAGALRKSADGARTEDLLRPTQKVLDTRKVPICRHFQAADGTRTHDLLHGKKNLIRRRTPLFTCEPPPFQPPRATSRIPVDSARFRGILRTISEWGSDGWAVCLPRRRSTVRPVDETSTLGGCHGSRARALDCRARLSAPTHRSRSSSSAAARRSRRATSPGTAERRTATKPIPAGTSTIAPPANAMRRSSPTACIKGREADRGRALSASIPCSSPVRLGPCKRAPFRRLRGGCGLDRPAAFACSDHRFDPRVADGPPVVTTRGIAGAVLGLAMRLQMGRAGVRGLDDLRHFVEHDAPSPHKQRQLGGASRPVGAARSDPQA
jgi:hypothetical protein